MFVWEDLGDKYKFRKDKNYIIYYRGSFLPVTKGHMSVIEEYIKYPNVKIFVSYIGDSKRHGVPHNFGKVMWKIYLSHFPKSKVIIKSFSSQLDILNFLENVYTVVYVRGNEKYDTKKKRKVFERKIIEKYDKLLNELEKRNINMDFIMMSRPLAKKLSATKFIEALNNNQSIRPFVPSYLSSKTISYLKSELQKFDLH